jgi:hypothetical protein
MSLEESVQHVLMNAIQELMVKENRKINEEYSELGDQVNHHQERKNNTSKRFVVLVKTCIRRIESCG